MTWLLGLRDIGGVQHSTWTVEHSLLLFDYLHSPWFDIMVPTYWACRLLVVSRRCCRLDFGDETCRGPCCWVKTTKISITMTSHGREDVSNHRSFSLFNTSFRWTIRKAALKSILWALCEGNSSLYNKPVFRTSFSYHVVLWPNISFVVFALPLVITMTS